MCLVAVPVLLIWTVAGAGYEVTTWGPGALFLLALLGLARYGIGGRLREAPLAVRVALGALAAYTAWSYASIAWASVPGDAWDGANRTLLYLIAFALFALWPQRAGGGAVLIAVWTLGMAAIAAFVLARVGLGSDPTRGLVWGRQADFAGYPNAAAATWLMPLWPALVLSARREVPWWLRGVFAAGAVGLADLALLAQSRGALYAVPIVAVIFFVLVPGRVRALIAVLPVAGAVAVTVPAVLDVFRPITSGEPVDPARLSHLIGGLAIAALVAGLVVAAVAAVERFRPPSPEVAHRAHRGAGAVAVAAVLAAVVVGLVLAGSPTARARSAWDSFKGGYATSTPSTRLISGLGSNRYDFYRVSLDMFLAHPVAGIGADNFAQAYLRRGRSDETPRYPHSVEMRTLSQTGIVGALILFAFLGAALAAVLRATRQREQLAGAIAGAGAVVFAYFMVHGSVDWFWEFAGLGAPAFAMLGLACGLRPRGVPEAAAPAPPRTPAQEPPPARFGGVALRVAADGVALVAAASLAAPWLAEASVNQATRTWKTDPAAAYRQLDRASTLNPLSDRPKLIEGTIALRLRDTERARRAFSQALDRAPDDQYATFELGAIAATHRQRAMGLRLLQRAVELSPRDPIARRALARTRAGRPLSVATLNRAILDRAAGLAR